MLECGSPIDQIIQYYPMTFSNLKKQSTLGNLTAKLVKEVEKLNSGSNGADERLWKPEVDSTGNGYSVIRFLPASEGEELPWAKLYNHAFQGTGGWLIDNCLTTLGSKCPICESNSLLWNSGSDANKEIARARKRKLYYYSNIYVIKDPKNPENEGKVFLFKYGKKIFDKIQTAMKPEFEDEASVNPFDMWKGADFKLKIKKVAGYWNYDSSEFSPSAPLLGGDDDVLEELWKKQYSLSDIISEDKFKSYDNLSSRLDVVLGKSASAKSSFVDESVSDEDEDRGPIPTISTEDEDDALSYFQKLVND